MSAAEITDQQAKSVRSVNTFSMTLSDASASVAAEALSGEIEKIKRAASSREIRPVNWLGRP